MTCVACGESTPAGQRYCDAECRADYRDWLAYQREGRAYEDRERAVEAGAVRGETGDPLE